MARMQRGGGRCCWIAFGDGAEFCVPGVLSLPRGMALAAGRWLLMGGEACAWLRMRAAGGAAGVRGTLLEGALVAIYLRAARHSRGCRHGQPRCSGLPPLACARTCARGVQSMTQCPMLNLRACVVAGRHGVWRMLTRARFAAAACALAYLTLLARGLAARRQDGEVSTILRNFCVPAKSRKQRAPLVAGAPAACPSSLALGAACKGWARTLASEFIFAKG